MMSEVYKVVLLPHCHINFVILLINSINRIVNLNYKYIKINFYIDCID